MTTELVVPSEVRAIRQRFEDQLPGIRQTFALELGSEIKKKRVWLIGGSIAGLLILTGTTIAALLKAAVIATGWGMALAALFGVGYVVKRMIPRWELQLAHSERLKIDKAMHAYIERKQLEMKRHIEAIMAEVRRNPIPFLNAEYVRRSQVYEVQKATVTRFAGRMSVYAQKFQRRQLDNPGMNLIDEARAVDRMQLWHKNRLDRLNDGYQKLIRYKAKLDEARIRWDLKLSAMEALAEEDRAKVDMEAMFQEVLTEVAFDQVHSEYEEVFARIEMDAREMAAQPKLEFAPGMSIDLSDACVPAAVPVPVSQPSN